MLFGVEGEILILPLKDCLYRRIAITAESEFDLDGVIDINTPDVDSVQLEELPQRWSMLLG